MILPRLSEHLGHESLLCQSPEHLELLLRAPRCSHVLHITYSTRTSHNCLGSSQDWDPSIKLINRNCPVASATSKACVQGCRDRPDFLCHLSHIPTQSHTVSRKWGSQFKELSSWITQLKSNLDLRLCIKFPERHFLYNSSKRWLPGWEVHRTRCTGNNKW